MAGRWPFVGRTRELARCLAVIESGSGVLLFGDPGVGKSALARAVLQRAAQAGAGVGLVSGRPVSSGAPFESLAAVVDRRADPHEAVLSPAAVNARLADALGADKHARTVLMVDDAHLLDVQSAEVVHRAARDGMLVLATVGSGMAQRTSIERLWRDGLCERLELGGLADHDLVDAIEAVLEGPLDPSAARAFTTRAQGNPLLLRELVNTALGRSTLVRDGAAWTLTGAPPLSSGTRELISERLIGMRGEQRAALETIATGEPLPLSVATSLLGAEMLDELDGDRLISVRDSLDGPEVSSAHPLYGDVLRAELPRLRLRRLRLRLAQSLEAAPRQSPHDLVRAAVWRMEGGQAQSTDRLLTAARAARAFSLPIAERLARRAHQNGGSLQATLLLAEILTHTGRGEAAGTLTAGLPPDSLTASDRESITYCAAMGQGLVVGDAGGGAQLVAAVLAGDPDASRQLRALHSALLAFDAHFAEALEVGLSLVDDVTAAVPVRTLAAIGVVGAEYWLGNFRQCVATADGLTAIAALARDVAPYGSGSLELMAVCALLESGHLDVAEARALRLRTHAIHDEDDFALPRAEYCLGRVSLLRGQPLVAERQFRRCLAALSSFDQFIVRHLSAMLARAAAMAGDVDAAAKAFELAGTAPRMKTYEPDWDLATAAVLAVSLRMPEAVDAAAWAGGVAADQQQWNVAVIAYHDASRYGGARQVLTPLREAAPRVDGPLAACYLDHAIALEGHDPTALEDVSRRFEAHGTVLFAAEAAAEAALAYGRRGEPRQARGSGARFARLRAQCEGAVFPWLSGTASAVPLTGRERQVAALAAAGRTDAKIAALLGISIRTVQSHLARVYAKLGVTSRGQLAGSLDPGPDGAP